MKETLNIERLTVLAKELRMKIIETSYRAKIPHLGSCLSCVEILILLYFNELKIDIDKPRWAERDRFILSKGHAAPALFQVLAMKGFYSFDTLSDYGKNGSIFAEHPPTPRQLTGIEAATGSLGHGLPLGLGMAMAARIQKHDYHVYVVLSDGECNEGSVWEAAMLASAQKLTNLTVIIDFNKWQATGRSRDIMHLDSLAEKWRAFNWIVEECDGHDMKYLKSSIDRLITHQSEKPSVIVAHTIKGKGVSFMEDDNNWHYRIPTEKDVIDARAELFNECQV